MNKQSIITATVAGSLLAVTAFAWIQQYGWNGRQGQTGITGQQGQQGPEQIVFADGSPILLTLRGRDGGTGGGGGHGGYAMCGRQPAGARNDLRAADGGPGGNGGNGGNGGDGGTTTIYYQDLANLKNILVDATPGRGGQPGQGGNGANGCRCEVYSWDVQECNPPAPCTTRRYNCQDGRDGAWGFTGNNGLDGRPGSLVLINREARLPQEVPMISAPIKDIEGQLLHLSKHIWRNRSGARALVAPNSIIADTAKEFVRRVEAQQVISWEASQPLDSVGSTGTVITINDTGETKVQFAPELWVQGFNEGNTFVIFNAVKETDVTRFNWGLRNNAEREFTMTVIDAARVSDIVNTEFRVRVEAKERWGGRDYRKIFDGSIPADQVLRDHQRFILSIGNIVSDSKYLKRGNQATVDLKIIRSMGDRSKESSLFWSGSI